MADPIMTLGKKLTDVPKRDAIHIAIAPMAMSTTTSPGTHVGIDRHGRASARAHPHVGILDPFLREPLKQSEVGWVFLYPNTVTGMRHEWSHPSFDAVEEVMPLRNSARYRAEKTIRDMAEKMGLSFDELLDFAKAHAAGRDGGYVTQIGGESWRDEFNADEFWPAYQVYTDTAVEEDKQDHFFSCSC